MDGQLTLVHFLDDVIETKYPEISGFEKELTHVEQAARGKKGVRHNVSFGSSRNPMLQRTRVTCEIDSPFM